MASVKRQKLSTDANTPTTLSPQVALSWAAGQSFLDVESALKKERLVFCMYCQIRRRFYWVLLQPDIRTFFSNIKKNLPIGQPVHVHAITTASVRKLYASNTLLETLTGSGQLQDMNIWPLPKLVGVRFLPSGPLCKPDKRLQGTIPCWNVATCWPVTISDSPVDWEDNALKALEHGENILFSSSEAASDANLAASRAIVQWDKTLLLQWVCLHGPWQALKSANYNVEELLASWPRPPISRLEDITIIAVKLAQGPTVFDNMLEANVSWQLAVVLAKKPALVNEVRDCFRPPATVYFGDSFKPGITELLTIDKQKIKTLDDDAALMAYECLGAESQKVIDWIGKQWQYILPGLLKWLALYKPVAEGDWCQCHSYNDLWLQCCALEVWFELDKLGELSKAFAASYLAHKCKLQLTEAQEWTCAIAIQAHFETPNTFNLVAPTGLLRDGSEICKLFALYPKVREITGHDTVTGGTFMRVPATLKEAQPQASRMLKHILTNSLHPCRAHTIVAHNTRWGQPTQVLRCMQAGRLPLPIPDWPTDEEDQVHHKKPALTFASAVFTQDNSIVGFRFSERTQTDTYDFAVCLAKQMATCNAANCNWEHAMSIVVQLPSKSTECGGPASLRLVLLGEQRSVWRLEDTVLKREYAYKRVSVLGRDILYFDMTGSL